MAVLTPDGCETSEEYHGECAKKEIEPTPRRRAGAGARPSSPSDSAVPHYHPSHDPALVSDDEIPW